MSLGLCVHSERRCQPLAASGVLFPPAPRSEAAQRGSHPAGSSSPPSVEPQTSSPVPQVAQSNISSPHSAAAVACSADSFPCLFCFFFSFLFLVFKAGFVVRSFPLLAPQPLAAA